MLHQIGVIQCTMRVAMGSPNDGLKSLGLLRFFPLILLDLHCPSLEISVLQFALMYYLDITPCKLGILHSSWPNSQKTYF
jgi:hypothetical protein